MEEEFCGRGAKPFSRYHSTNSSSTTGPGTTNGRLQWLNNMRATLNISRDSGGGVGAKVGDCIQRPWNKCMLIFPLQWNAYWETIAMRDHLSWKNTFLWPIGWSFKTGSTVASFLIYIDLFPNGVFHAFCTHTHAFLSIMGSDGTSHCKLVYHRRNCITAKAKVLDDMIDLSDSF